MVNKYKERLKHYTINRKLKATLGVVALIACIIGVILISGILAVANNVKGIYQGPMNNVNDIANVKYGLTDLQRAINRLLAEGSDNMADRYANFEKTVEEDVNLVVSGVDDMDKHFKTEATRAKLSEMQAKINEGEKVRPQVMQLLKSGKIDDIVSYRAKVSAREEESTTGIGEGIAIPHGKCDAVKNPGLAAMVVKNGVEFEALDDEPVTLLFLIAAPNTEDNIHLDVLSKLSVMLIDDNFTESLRNAGSVDEFMEIIDKADEEKKDIDERLADTGSSEGARAKLLAVTSCPTGIAHTYMVAEGLEKAAKAKDCFIKIETRGSSGAKNVLTDQEIREADCIIVAADAKVPMDRFDGKKVIECQVSDGISKADQ